MLDLLSSIWDLIWMWVGAPMLIGFLFLGAISFIHLVMEKLNKSDLLKSFMDYWWGMFFISWVAGIVLFGFGYYWSYLLD